MFKEKRNTFDGKKYYEVSIAGKQLLLNSFLNKDTAFTLEERREFKLDGLIPNVVETLDEQVVRVYGQYLKKESDIERNIFLTQLYDRNETLFLDLCKSTSLKWYLYFTRQLLEMSYNNLIKILEDQEGYLFLTHKWLR